MASLSFISVQKGESLYRWASALALITIFYNIFEGIVSVFFGLKHETIGRESFQNAKKNFACSCAGCMN